MSSGRGAPRGPRDQGDRGRGGARGARGARGGNRGGRGGSMELPIREGDASRGNFRGRGRGRGFEFGDRGRGAPRGGSRGGFAQGPRIYSPEGGLPPPNAQIRKTEDAVAAVIAKKPRKPTSYPERPGYGTRGQPVSLYANYFDLTSVGKQLYRYNVDVEPDQAKKPGGKKARQIIRLLLDEHFPKSSVNIVTDYKSTMVTNIKILEDDNMRYDYEVRYKDEHEDEYPDNPKMYLVRCQFTGHVNPGDLLSYLTSTDANALFESKQDVLQAMNIVLGHDAKTNMSIASVGANKHFAVRGPLTEKWNLEAGLQAYRGFFVSVRAATARLLVNVQVKYVACYQEGPLAVVIREYQRAYRNIHQLNTFLRGLRVRVTHIQRKNKKGDIVPRFKTIGAVATPRDGAKPNPPKVSSYGAGPKDVQFFLETPGQAPAPQSSSGGKEKKGKKPAKAGPAPAGKYISVAEFFRQQYNMETNPNLPVVNVGTRENPSYLPVEACMVEPGQPAKAKLSPSQTRNMMSFAVRPPAQNAESIVKNGTQVLGLAPANAALVEFGMEVNPQLITVQGRVLPAPNVYYKDAKQAQKQIMPMGGSWNMRSIRFFKPSELVTWTWFVLDIDGQRLQFDNPNDLNGPLQKFTDKLNEIGVRAKPPKVGMRISVDMGNIDAGVDHAISELMTKHKPTLIVGILPFNNAEIYNCIKRACDIKHGVRNINVLGQHFKEAKDQYIANVGLKFNLKLGGVNQTLKPNELGIISEGKTMLIGIDVTHPSPGSSKEAPSVAGMVASMDAVLGQWPAELRIQKSRQEMVEDLDAMLKAHLDRWARAHKSLLPENLIVYRDGVSEGQYETVLERELPLLRKACKETYPASDTKKGLPRISIMCVGKRHHTRFYPTADETADRFANPANGTVVDRGVTEARNWDFYLQAHTALKGTARPAHYFTLWDEIFYKQKPAPPHQNAADVLETLTHHLCYLFGRATKAVSICPPAYYADLVCTRARCYLAEVFDPSSSAASVTTGSGGGLKPETSNVTIHHLVRDTMFYI
ncbi:hypothetical protein FE257_007879 [Aspergillus nanangensis]|uniref:Piwi domain-containing protein n=1 Tax=Aspergillus nanangensis TaxID=2582783 RepID=A0AAD4CX70_ASPNN|nr:hypothetical protein FE257_007879 [Aspergillus nanangensis]